MSVDNDPFVMVHARALLQSAPERVTPNTVPARSDAAQSQRRRPSRPAAPEGTCR
jgi:hypothetical protein